MEAVLFMTAWLILSNTDPPIPPISAIAMVSQFPAGHLVVALLRGKAEVWVMATTIFLLQSLVLAALTYAVLALRDRVRPSRPGV